MVKTVRNNETYVGSNEDYTKGMLYLTDIIKNTLVNITVRYHWIHFLYAMDMGTL